MVGSALYIAASGMGAQQAAIETISNNIANLNTTAYKEQSVETEDNFYQHLKRAGEDGAGTIIPAGIYLGTGTKVQDVSRSLKGGNYYETGSDLHVAIKGIKGYFKIEMPDGSTSYTRSGNFGRNADGQIVTQEGYLVAPEITIPIDARDLMIAEDGTVSILLPNVIQPQILGQFVMVDFINKGGLEVIGKNLYVETISSGPALEGIAGGNGFATLQQRWLESSNVDMAIQLTKLVGAQRAYEMNAKLIQVSDDMMQTLNQAKK